MKGLKGQSFDNFSSFRSFWRFYHSYFNYIRSLPLSYIPITDFAPSCVLAFDAFVKLNYGKLIKCYFLFDNTDSNKFWFTYLNGCYLSCNEVSLTEISGYFCFSVGTLFEIGDSIKRGGTYTKLC